jgi:hypothetical protein
MRRGNVGRARALCTAAMLQPKTAWGISMADAVAQMQMAEFSTGQLSFKVPVDLRFVVAMRARSAVCFKHEQVQSKNDTRETCNTFVW